jgi:imidazolonepropionase-like amidohydrolase
MCCDASSWRELNLGFLDGVLPPPSVYHAQLHDDDQQGQGQGQGRQGRQGGGPGGGGVSPEQITERIKELDDLFAKARDYAASAPEVRDLRMEAMRPYVNGEKPVVMQARTAATIRAAVDFAKRNRLRVVLTGAAEAWKEAELLAREGIPVVFTPWGEACLSANSPTSQWDPYDTGYVAPSILAKAGVRFGFEMGDDAMVMNLPFRAGMACAYGLSRDDAIKALTIWPAEMYGVSDRVGSLEVGKDAEFFVCEGDPLDTTANMRYLFIGGHPAPLVSRFTLFRDKYLARLSN